MTREEAIDFAKFLKNNWLINFADMEEFCDIAIEALKAEPIKHGEWIVYPLMDEGRVELECPICGDTFIRSVDYKPHFCENCGAKMDKEE